MSECPACFGWGETSFGLDPGEPGCPVCEGIGEVGAFQAVSFWVSSVWEGEKEALGGLWGWVKGGERMSRNRNGMK